MNILCVKREMKAIKGTSRRKVIGVHGRHMTLSCGHEAPHAKEAIGDKVMCVACLRARMLRDRSSE